MSTTPPSYKLDVKPEVGDEYFLQIGKCTHTLRVGSTSDIDRLIRQDKEQLVEGLEEEVERYFQGLWPGMETAEQCNTDMRFTPPAIMRLARHFYELGQQSRPKILDNSLKQPASEEKIRNLLDAVGDCGFSQDDILLLKSIWDEENAADEKVVKELSEKVSSEITRQVEDAIISEGLEEEIEKCLKQYNMLAVGKKDFTDIAHHFYDLGCTRAAVMYDEIEYNRQRAEEAELSGDLDEEVKRYWNDHALEYRIGRVADIDFLQLAARHFAEWGAEHLKK